MHGLPLFQAPSFRHSVRRLVLACTVAAAGLTWAVPDVAQAYTEAMALERAGIGRSGHSLRPKRILSFIKHLPGKVRVPAMSVRKRLTKKKPALVADGSLENRKPHHEGEATRAKEQSDRGQGDKPRVLIVDDRVDNQGILQLMFEGVGCEVVVAAAGEKETNVVVAEGLRLIAEGAFHGVGSDGLEGEWPKIADAAKEKGIGCCVITGRPDQHEALARDYDIPLYAKPASLKHFEEMRDYFVRIAGAGDQQQPE